MGGAIKRSTKPHLNGNEKGCAGIALCAFKGAQIKTRSGSTQANLIGLPHLDQFRIPSSATQKIGLD
jgi:hypothetical protein